jgi:hypothetical protein
MNVSKELYILYKTTNTVNGKFYIGVHHQKKKFHYSVSDGYLGSGRTLETAIKKYGKENFSRETLAVFSDKKFAYQVEKLYVDKDFLKRKDVYNGIVGGNGDKWSERDKKKHSEDSRRAGLKTVELKLGIHGRSKEQRLIDARLAAPLGGKAARDQNKGFHAFSKEEREFYAVIAAEEGW